MMRLSFEVSGSTIDEIEREARDQLRRINGEDGDDNSWAYRWSLHYDIRPHIITPAKGVVVWIADVTAERISRPTRRKDV
jgi:hypothetical protein